MIRKIPVFGTQTLNSFTNLKNLINSIDYPVEILSNEFGDPMRWDYNFDYRENKIFRYSKYY